MPYIGEKGEIDKALEMREYYATRHKEDKERLEGTIIVLEGISRMLKHDAPIDWQLQFTECTDPEVKDPVRAIRDIYAEDVDYAVNLLKKML